MDNRTIDNWAIKDTGVIRLPRGEKFVSFMKIKRKLFVLSNKAIYEIVMNKTNKVSKKARLSQ